MLRPRRTETGNKEGGMSGLLIPAGWGRAGRRVELAEGPKIEEAGRRGWQCDFERERDWRTTRSSRLWGRAGWAIEADSDLALDYVGVDAGAPWLRSPIWKGGR